MRSLLWVLAAVLATALPAAALDHRDGPAATQDPALDLTELYAWMSADATRLNLVLAVHPLADGSARFATDAQYVFHLGGPQDFAPDRFRVVCTFDAAQVASCWLVDLGGGGEVLDFATGDASGTAGIQGTNGRLKVFAGLRKDAVFANLEGIGDMVSTLAAAKPSLQFDLDGCPAIDAQTSAVLVAMLKGTQKGMAPAKDIFATADVLALVVTLPADLVGAPDPVVGVWASTNR